MKPECKERERTSVSNKPPRKKWPRWLWIVTAGIVILVLAKPFVLPPLVDCFGTIMYEVYNLIEYAITIVATGASLYSVGLAVEGGKDMKDVFEKLGSLDENIFGRLDELDRNVLTKLEKLDGDVFAKLEKLDGNVFDRLEKLDDTVIDRLEKMDEDIAGRVEKMNRTVSAKLMDLDIGLLYIHEDLMMLSQKEDVARAEVGKGEKSFGSGGHTDEIDDSKRESKPGR